MAKGDLTMNMRMAELGVLLRYVHSLVAPARGVRNLVGHTAVRSDGQ